MITFLMYSIECKNDNASRVKDYCRERLQMGLEIVTGQLVYRDFVKNLVLALYDVISKHISILLDGSFV